MSGADALVRMLPSLAIIVGALLLLRHWAQKGRGGSAEPLRVLSRAGIGKGSVVAVVEVGHRRLLVGAADQGIRLLVELDDAPSTTVPQIEQADVTPASAVVPPTDRRRLLEQLRSTTSAAPVAPAPVTPTTDRPRMAPIDRLRHMTVRTPVGSHPSRPNRAHPRP